MENSVYPDQMASLESSWSGCTLFSKKINPGLARQRLNENNLPIKGIIILRYLHVTLSASDHR